MTQTTSQLDLTDTLIRRGLLFHWPNRGFTPSVHPQLSPFWHHSDAAVNVAGLLRDREVLESMCANLAGKFNLDGLTRLVCLSPFHMAFGLEIAVQYGNDADCKVSFGSVSPNPAPTDPPTYDCTPSAGERVLFVCPEYSTGVPTQIRKVTEHLRRLDSGIKFAPVILAGVQLITEDPGAGVTVRSAVSINAEITGGSKGCRFCAAGSSPLMACGEENWTSLGRRATL